MAYALVCSSPFMFLNLQLCTAESKENMAMLCLQLEVDMIF